MKQRYGVLSVSIAAALAGLPSLLLAQSLASDAAGFTSTEAPRVTQNVSDGHLTTLTKTHLGFIAGAPSTPLAGSTSMNHLQLVLKPSASRTAAMEALIANQHTPQSAQFHKWLTPVQFGEQFGVVDSDIAAVTAWLTSQGFTVNNVYPNKTQIDFSGTVAQVNQAFHTQENIYTINNVKHLASASDISIPTALAPVVAGVMGLNNFYPTALTKSSTSHVAQWDASTKRFIAKTAASGVVGLKPITEAIPLANNGPTVRALVPNDLVTMYGIRTIRNNGVTGKGITIAVVEDGDMVPADWTNFVSQFNLGQYGGTFSQINPAPASGPTNCTDPSVAWQGEWQQTVIDAEWTTAIAPGANIEVASCSDFTTSYAYATSNFFGGIFIAATNLINVASGRPDVIDVGGYGFAEFFVDSASKAAIDAIWAQADAEGISVFTASGNNGTSQYEFGVSPINGYYGDATISANALATSTHDTAVGGTDLADILDGTTPQYFAATPSVVGGSALSYVPEIPWNASCGNGVAAKAFGYSSAVAFCQDYYLPYDPDGYYLTSTASSGAPSSVDAKPAWQQLVYNAAQDQSRDVPDVALFAGSFSDYTEMVACNAAYPCTPGWSGPVDLQSGTQLSAAMFAGVQALIDQGIAERGLPADQGNAAPTLYALAAKEYGGSTGPTPASLATCNADNGASGTGSCVFHNVTQGSISVNCLQLTEPAAGHAYTTANCYYFGTIPSYLGEYGFGPAKVGLVTIDATPTTYGVANKAYGAQPGWSFASGLGSVNVTNLLIAWRAYVGAPPAL
jgi:subtilase family serine protease